MDGERAGPGSKNEGLYKHGDKGVCPPGQRVLFRDRVLGSVLLRRLAPEPLMQPNGQDGMGVRNWVPDPTFEFSDS